MSLTDLELLLKEELKQILLHYKEGFNFQGRGIKQITHDYDYLEYYDFVNGTTLFKDKYSKPKIGEGVSEFVITVKNKDLNVEFIDSNLVLFTKK